MARAAATKATIDSGGETVLAPTTRVRGRVRGDGDLRVEGAIEGNVAVTGALSIEEGGSIKGDIEAASLVVSGALTGDVSARGAVAIRAGANVSGNMGGSEVSLEEGASFSGRIEAEFDLPAELKQGSAPAAAPAGRKR